MMCENINSYMSVTNRSDIPYFDSKRVVGDVFYWTGLHRKDHRTWVLGMMCLLSDIDV